LSQDTPPPTPPPPEPPTSRSRTAITVALTAVTVALLLWAAYELASRPKANIPTRPRTHEFSLSSDGGHVIGLPNTDDSDIISRIGEGASTEQLMMTHRNDRQMTAEPADLRPYPGGERIAGIRSLTDGYIDERVSWELPAGEGMVDKVLEHYRTQGVAAGFVEHDAGVATDSKTEARSLRMVRVHEASKTMQILTVRADASGDTVRVLVWLGYPAPDDAR